MTIWTPQQLSEALSINFSSNVNFGKVQFNSQNVQKGDIFIALTGGIRDGHEFVEEAINQGANLVIVSKKYINIPASKIIVVENTFTALHKLAQYKRKKSKAKFIAITGSVGKTTVKEMLTIALGSFGNVFSGRGNFNNHIGVPLNLASMSDDNDFVIIEMGMRGVGQIRDLAKQVMPDIAIVTSVAEGHLKFFDSVDNIADAKCEIFETLDVNDGKAIINRDISTFKRCWKNLDKLGVKNITSFGCSDFANARLVEYNNLPKDLVELKFLVGKQLVKITRKTLPKHMAFNFAAILAVVDALELDLNKSIEALVDFEPIIGRGKFLNINQNGKKYSIIADYYNANPESMKASLEYLSQIKNSKKMAILGDMVELGKDELKFHKEMVEHILKSGANKVFLVGDIMPQIADDIPSEISVYLYKNTADLYKDITKYVENNEVILLKASRFIGFERIAKILGVENAL